MPFFLLILLVCLACSAGPSPPERGAAGDSGSGALARPSAAPPVIRGPTVVAFWLAASDTLEPGRGADLLDDFRHYTALVAPSLEAAEIALVATTADSVIVELDRGPRRVIMLAGLDFPFGYVLVEPGYPETILTGVTTDEELLDEVDWYFGLSEGEDVPRGESRPRPERALWEGRGAGPVGRRPARGSDLAGWHPRALAWPASSTAAASQRAP
ncbi:MAG TPA: hypothetical protein VNJ71_12100 [Gemmatimonadales bacterium]|nr:hypothetical protein [Gemmatimonadales bacterium]